MHWVHDIDPYLVRFDGISGITWYGFAYLLGMTAGWLLLSRWRRSGHVPSGGLSLPELVVVMSAGVVFGGRIGYCLFYSPDLFVDFEGRFPYWGVLRSSEGGMSSHGGILGIAMALLLIRFERSDDRLVLADSVATVAPIGVFFGRIANFINGELYGREARLPWAVHFPESVNELDHTAFHTRWDAAQILHPLSSAGQSYGEYLRQLPNLDAWRQVVRTMTVPRHPSQLYEAALEGAAVFLLARWTLRRHRRPGLNCAIVLGAYSIARMVCERFRQWDIGHDPVLSLTKGQLYTLPLLVTALLLAWRGIRRGPTPRAYRSSSTNETV